MSLPAESEPARGPRPDPLAQHLGKRPDLMAASLEALSCQVVERLACNPAWPDVQVNALGWAAATKELGSLLLQREAAIQRHANVYHEGNSDAANFELVGRDEFKAQNRRIRELRADIAAYEKRLKTLSQQEQPDL